MNNFNYDDVDLIVRYFEKCGYSECEITSPYNPSIEYSHPNGKRCGVGVGNSQLGKYSPSIYKKKPNGEWGWTGIRGYLQTQEDMVKFFMEWGMGIPSNANRGNV